ncbi:MAG: hypothetical protein JXC33_07795 [Deltaproteobacteria bacterium]|nr:hypothetical protein [Deltaproteobacteria bacterium]
MEKKWYNILPVRTLIYLSVSIFIVVIFLLVIVYPYYQSLGTLDKEIAGMYKNAEKQKVLLPLYMKLVQKSEASVPDKLSLPIRKSLPPNNIDLIPPLIKGIARKAGMQAVMVNPDLTTLATRKDFLLIYATVRGSFFDVRNFLIELGKVPYIDHIEEIDIQQKMTDKECKLKLWFAVS